MSLVEFYFFSMCVITLWCAGFRQISDYTEKLGGGYDDKMILWWFRWLLLKIGFFGKPLGSCIYCMPSVHGSIIYWMLALMFFPDQILFSVIGYPLVSSIPRNLLIFWPIVCVSCSFTAGFIWNRIKRY